MPKFTVTAERSLGIPGAAGRTLNPFKVSNLFDSTLRARFAVREWTGFEADDEAHVRRLFDEFADSGPLRGFKLVSVRAEPPTSEGQC